MSREREKLTSLESEGRAIKKTAAATLTRKRVIQKLVGLSEAAAMYVSISVERLQKKREETNEKRQTFCGNNQPQRDGSSRDANAQAELFAAAVCPSKGAARQQSSARIRRA